MDRICNHVLLYVEGEEEVKRKELIDYFKEEAVRAVSKLASELDQMYILGEIDAREYFIVKMAINEEQIRKDIEKIITEKSDINMEEEVSEEELNDLLARDR